MINIMLSNIYIRNSVATRPLKIQSHPVFNVLYGVCREFPSCDEHNVISSTFCTNPLLDWVVGVDLLGSKAVVRPPVCRKQVGFLSFFCMKFGYPNYERSLQYKRLLTVRSIIFTNSHLLITYNCSCGQIPVAKEAGKGSLGHFVIGKHLTS